jgi:hypothetical protein
LLNALGWFFDLYSQYKGPQAVAQASDEQIAGWRQFVLYVSCVVGILVGPYAANAAAGNYSDFATMFGSWIRLFWAVVFGFVLTAALFKTVVSATTPLVVQIGTAIVAGFASGNLVPKAIELLSKWPSHA